MIDTKQLCHHAVSAARKAGASYSDARFVRINRQRIVSEDARIDNIEDFETMGIGIRVMADNAWGFASTPLLTGNSVERTALQAMEIARASALLKGPDGIRWALQKPCTGSHRTPIVTDPFDVSIKDKCDLLLEINNRVLGVAGISKSNAFMLFYRTNRILVNSEGTDFESEIFTSYAHYKATAVDANSAKSRTCEAYPKGIGYEHVTETPLLENAEKTAEEAIRKLKGKPGPVGKADLVLAPSNLWLVIHESIGHATELDRVLGMEESLAGSSFATIDNLDRLRYGSPIMNIVCDNTLPCGMATWGCDDDGVPGEKWHVIKDGILVDYQTSREVCHAIESDHSHGSCRADSWSSIPIVRQSNICLAPGTGQMSPEDLIAGVDDGVYIEGIGSYSIDQRRQNFQFGGDWFREIKNGRLGDVLSDVTFQAITTDFWGSMDATCDERFWEPYGAFNCGKGDPMQLAQMTHGCAHSRFRNINVGGAPS